jgi:hypothetical protein
MDGEAAAEGAQHIADQRTEDPRIALDHQHAEDHELRRQKKTKGVDAAQALR